MSAQSSTIEAFKPSYVWPNPAIHFRVYFEHPRCRIFLIENITHNWAWLKAHARHIQPRDYFVVLLGWHFHDWLVQESKQVLDLLGLPIDRFVILFNDEPTRVLFEYHGFRGGMVNQNAFLDENLFTPLVREKIFDAVYVARFAPFKRHHLARQVSQLALVAGQNYSALVDEIPPHAYLNERPLKPSEVQERIAQSHVGLLLSEAEGACFSSSEYLLCGVPVVSTWCYGGRAVWYNDYNAQLCEADPQSVADAVQRMKSLRRKPERIRAMHLQQAETYRRNFIELLAMIFRECDVREDADDYFRKNFQHKMLSAIEPPFDVLFGRS